LVVHLDTFSISRTQRRIVTVEWIVKWKVCEVMSSRPVGDTLSEWSDENHEKRPKLYPGQNLKPRSSKDEAAVLLTPRVFTWHTHIHRIQSLDNFHVWTALCVTN
jgi:hypothetical protein